MILKRDMSFVKRIDNEFEMYFGPAGDKEVIVQWGGIEGGICRDNVVYLHQGESLGNLSFSEMVAAQSGVILWDPALKKGRFLVTNSRIPKRSLLSIFGGRLPFIFILAAVTTAFVWFFSK